MPIISHDAISGRVIQRLGASGKAPSHGRSPHMCCNFATSLSALANLCSCSTTGAVAQSILYASSPHVAWPYPNTWPSSQPQPTFAHRQSPVLMFSKSAGKDQALACLTGDTAGHRPIKQQAPPTSSLQNHPSSSSCFRAPSFIHAYPHTTDSFDAPMHMLHKACCPPHALQYRAHSSRGHLRKGRFRISSCDPTRGKMRTCMPCASTLENIGAND